MRLPHIRKDRQCIRPEVNRVFHFGAVGESGGQFYKEYLSRIKMNEVPYTWFTPDETLRSYIDRVATDDNYARWIASEVTR